MKTLFAVIVALAFSVLLFSCKKEKTYSELILGKWKLTNMTCDSSGAITPQTAVQDSIYYTFTPDSLIAEYFVGGPMFFDDTLAYSIVGNALKMRQELLVAVYGFDTADYQIEQLNSNSMRLSQGSPIHGNCNSNRTKMFFEKR